MARDPGSGPFSLMVVTTDGHPVFGGFVYTANGERLAVSARGDFLGSLPDERSDRHSIVSVGGRSYFTSVRPFGPADWLFVALAPAEKLIHGASRFARVALIVAGLCILIGVVVVFVFARVLYQPVARLSDQVEQVFAASGLDVGDRRLERNKLKRIAWEFSLLVDANQEYARRLLRDRVALKETLLRDTLAHRFVSAAEVRQRAVEVGLGSLETNVGLLLVAAPSDGVTFSMGELARRERIERLSSETLGDQALIDVLIEIGYYVVVVQFDAELTDGEANRLMDELATGLSRGEDEPLIISAGLASSIEELPANYAEAVKLYGMRRALVRRRVLRVADREASAHGRSQVAAFEHQMAGYRHALQILDIERARALGASLLEELGASVDVVYRQAKIHEIGSGLISTALSSTALGEIFNPDHDPWAEFQQLGSMEAVHRWFTRTIDAIETAIEARRKDGTSNLVSRIRTELDTRYAEPITVDSLADQFQITPSYLSSLFHEETGKTFSATLSELRLEHACRLLRETDLLIKQIAGESGYGQKQNMIRAFKRQLDMTPGEYRRQYQSISS